MDNVINELTLEIERLQQELVTKVAFLDKLLADRQSKQYEQIVQENKRAVKSVLWGTYEGILVDFEGTRKAS